MDRLEQAEQILRRPRRALFVDDDDLLRESLKLGFEDSPEVNITLVPDGETAISLLMDGKERFDCIILDLDLGGGHMDGVDIFIAIKNKHKDIPVAFLTGYPDDQRFQEAARHGYWFMVYTKPVNLDELKNTICSLVKREMYA